MANRIIKQPDGNYAVYCTVVDDFTLINAPEQDIVDFYLESMERDVRWDVGKTICMLENGDKPYYQFTESFEEALENIERVHGKKQRDKRLAQCGGDDDTSNQG
jgi:hypothetical protein